MNADLLAVLTFTAGYNTAIAMAGCAALGAAGGGVGVFLLLRARAMAADAAGHATLPGIVLAFLLAGWAGAEARSLPVLLAGAAVTGALGMALIVAAGRTTRLGADAAIAITLSVSYALGIVLLSYVQTRPDTAQGGLHTFILGQAAALSAWEAIAVGMLAAVAVLILSLLFRPLTLLCFDADQARSEGWPVVPLDMLLVGLGLAVVLFGLQAVGLVLVVSLLILPAASARFWTGRLVVVFRLAVAFGAGGAWLGAGASAVWPRLPTGPSIVLALGGLFVGSLLLAPHRGALAECLRRGGYAWRLRALRAMGQGRRYPGTGLFGWTRNGTPTERGRAALARLELWDRCLAEMPEAVPERAAWGIAPVPADAVRMLERSGP